jgi:hypothetical protein
VEHILPREQGRAPGCNPQKGPEVDSLPSCRTASGLVERQQVDRRFPSPEDGFDPGVRVLQALGMSEPRQVQENPDAASDLREVKAPGDALR